MIRSTTTAAPAVGIGTALLDIEGRLTEFNRTLATLLDASAADLDLTSFEGLFQGFSFRNAAAGIGDRVHPEREVVCEVTWSHPRSGARSGRVVVTLLNEGGGEPRLVVRLAPDVDPLDHRDPTADGADHRRDPLVELGCRLGQGWLWARPGPLEDLLPRLGAAN